MASIVNLCFSLMNNLAGPWPTHQIPQSINSEFITNFLKCIFFFQIVAEEVDKDAKYKDQKSGNWICCIWMLAWSMPGLKCVGPLMELPFLFYFMMRFFRASRYIYMCVCVCIIYIYGYICSVTGKKYMMVGTITIMCFYCQFPSNAHISVFLSTQLPWPVRGA